MADEADITDRKRPGRLARRVGAVGLGLVVALSGAWLFRLPLGEALIKASLGPGGAQTDFRLQAIDFNGVTASAVRIGPVDKPDLWAEELRLVMDWSRGLPRVGTVAFRNGGLRARIDDKGLSLGALEKLGPSKVATVQPELPDWTIAISNFHLIGETPFGVIDAPLTASGRLRQDFKAHAEVPAKDLIGPKGGAEAFEAVFDAATIKGRLNVVLDASSSTLAWRDNPDAPGTEISGARLAAQFATPVDLTSAEFGLALTADEANLNPSTDIHALRTNFRATFGAFKPGLKPGDFKGAYEIETGESVLGMALESLAVKGPFSGDLEKAPRIGIQAGLLRTPDMSLALANTRVDYALGDKGSVHLVGPATFNGPIAGVQLVDARTPLDLGVTWGDGFRVTPAGCAPIVAAKAIAPGATFEQAKATICPIGADFAAGDRAGRLSGGFKIAGLVWRGRMDGAERAPAQLNAGAIEGKLGGAGARWSLDVNAASPALAAEYPSARHLRVRAQAVTARVLNGKGWSVAGVISKADIEDTTLPGRLQGFDASWNGAPRGDGQAVFHIENGRGRLFDPADKALFHPLIASGVTAIIQDNKVNANGVIGLEEKPAKLGAFTLTHDFGGTGEVRAIARDLTFTAALQPYDVSELARGVIDNVRGPVDVDLNARWNTKATTTDGLVKIKDIDLASSSLGPIEGLSGDIVIDDLTRMTTPPGQTLRIRMINPGIKVADGTVAFALQENQHIAIERAQWPFAQGILAVAPTTIDLGGEETRLSLTLTDVDVAALTEALNVKGLAATGRVQGRFPLIFTKTKGRLENGRLEAAPGGGTISYDGGFSGAGTSKIAFDALRAFHYDTLSLDLNGDLDGELVSAIHFTGVNQEPMNPGQSPLPIKVVGIPFKFNVTVRAPFMSLANSMAGLGDARQYLKNAETKVDAQMENEGAPAAPPPQ